MKFGAFISRTDSLKKKLGRSDIIEKALIKSMQKSVLKLHRVAVKSIQARQSSGEPEKRYNPNRFVSPSLPGFPPNTDTGRLVQSIQFEFDDGGRAGRVGTNLKYGAYLEFGTEKKKGKPFIEPRPWLGPALNEVSEGISEEMKSGVNTGIFKAMGIKNVVKDLKGFGKSIGKNAKRTSKTIKKGIKKTKKALKKSLKRVF